MLRSIDEDTVAICMATYNGERYLPEQIDSILNQSYDNWVLFIRDDDSADKTQAILDTFQCNHSDRIIVLKGLVNEKRSSWGNFFQILKWVRSNYHFRYFMFSDQDDIWLPDKIEKTLKCMKETEKSAPGPVLVHTDLKVADENLNEIGSSFFKYRALDSSVRDLNHLLVQNNATGCTMMWNEEMDRIVSSCDGQAAMHDWWFSLVACCFGKISVVLDPTILYRQHENNVIGATKVNTLGFIIMRLMGKNRVKETLEMSVRQAEAFLECYRDRLSVEQIKILERYSKLYKGNKLKRVFTVLNGRYLKQGIVQIIGELMFI